MSELDPFTQPAQAVDVSEEENFLAEFDVGKLMRVLRKKLIYIILLFFLSLAGAWVILRYTKRIYESKSVLKLEMKGTSEVLGIGIFSSEDKINNFLLGEIELIQSRAIYEEIVNKLDLNVSYFTKGRWWFNYFERFQNSPFEVSEYEVYDNYFNDRPIDLQIIDEEEFVISYTNSAGEGFSKIYKFGTRIKNQYFSLIITLNPDIYKKNPTTDNYFFKINSREAQIQYISSALKANILNPKAYTIQVSFTDPNPYKAAIIVNTAVDIYFDKTLENKNKVFRQTITYLEERVKEVQDSLESAEKAIEQYKQDRGISDKNIEEIQNAYKAQLELNQKLAERQNELNRLLDTYKDIAQLVAMDSDSTLQVAQIYAIKMPSPFLKEKITKLYEEQKKKKLMLERLTPKTSAYQQKQIKIEQLRGEINRLLLINEEELLKELYVIKSELAKASTQLPSMNEVDLELRRLIRYYDSYQSNYNILLGKLVETSIAMAGTVTNYQRLSEAIPNKKPIYPEPQLFYLYGLAAWLFLSVIIIGWTYLRQNKVDSIVELEKLATVPILGMVPQYTKKMDYSQLVVNKKPKSSISEAFRSLRTNLDFMGDISHNCVISITSTTSGEGKTFIAVNLGGIIAMSQTKVVLLDLDLRKPKVHLAFGTANKQGMSALLADKASIDEVINKSEIENFDFITAGVQPPNPSELLMSEQFGKLLKQLKERYDVVIFDMPPVGLVTDGIIAMRHVDLPIYVVRAEYTRRAYVRGINRLYQVQNFKKLSIVFNAATKYHTYGYGYGYGYGYEYGYGYGYGYYEDDEGGNNLFIKLSRWIKNIKRRLKQ